MKKKEFIKNENSINQSIEQLQAIATILQENLIKLNEFNSINHLITNELIYELSTNKDNNNILATELKRIHILDSPQRIDEKVKELNVLLFTKKEIKQQLQNIAYHGDYVNLNELIKPLMGYSLSSEFEEKESFNFDFLNNTVSLKNEVIEKINKKYTLYIDNSNQTKVLESINKIDAEFQEILKYYDNKGDFVTNDLYRNLLQCYQSDDIFKQKKLNLYSIYTYILSSLKLEN